MSDFPFKVGDFVASYYSDVGLGAYASRTDVLDHISKIDEIIKERIVVVKGYERYADSGHGIFRQFSNEGYCHKIIRLLDTEGKIAAEAVLAEQKRQRDMRYEIDLLVQLHRETNTQAFLEHVKAFRGV